MKALADKSNAKDEIRADRWKKDRELTRDLETEEKLVGDDVGGPGVNQTGPVVLDKSDQDIIPSIIQGDNQGSPVKYTSLIDTSDTDTVSKSTKGDILGTGIQGLNSFNTVLPIQNIPDKNIVPLSSLIAKGDQLVADPVTGAVKADGNKVLLQLLPLRAVNAVGVVMTHGAKKYSSNNWRGGFKYTRVCGAAMRHLFAWMCGEDKDPDSGLCHISHAATNLLFLSEMIITQTGEDDRYIYPSKDSS